MAPGTDEKVTDGARGLYEKATGYVVFLRASELVTLYPPCTKTDFARVCLDPRWIRSTLTRGICVRVLI